MSVAIKVENLSKRCLIRHQRRERYATLRDSLASGAGRLIGRLNGKAARDPETEEEFWALRDIDFEIHQGERVGIIGRNGAGKSTLLKILSRITDPTAGRIRVSGNIASLLEVGTGFHPELTGRENIFLNGAILGMTRAEIQRKFDEIVDFAEVEKFLDTPVKRYSSGMYVRLAFAVAAHLEPDIMVIDEVLSVGDAQFQKKCLGRMEEVGRNGRTVIFVSHSMHTVLSLCNRGILLEQGRIAAVGSITDVVTAYSEQGASCGMSREWAGGDGPGNEMIRVLRARVELNDNVTNGCLTVNTPFTIAVEYRTNLTADLFYVGARLKTIYGELVFPSGCAPMLIEPGVYRSEYTIPGDLLNDGVYTIDVGFVRDGANLLYRAEELLTFEVHDVERPPGAWMGKIPGTIRPRLDWKTRRLSA